MKKKQLDREEQPQFSKERAAKDEMLKVTFTQIDKQLSKLQHKTKMTNSGFTEREHCQKFMKKLEFYF